MRYNSVQTHDDRLLVYEDSRAFRFFDILLNPTWTSDVLVRRQYVSTDGENFAYETDELLFGAYFFLSG